KKSGVRGFDPEELRRVIRSFKEENNNEENSNNIEENAPVLRYPLVEGKAPTRGEDREITLLFTPLPAERRTLLLERLADLKILPDSRQGFPFSEAEHFCPVNRGTRIARLSRPANGEQGRNVYGALIPGLPGGGPELKLFRGLRQSGGLVTADTAGLLLARAAGPGPGGGFSVFWGTVIDYRDARVRVSISEDGMEAAGELSAELGPALPLTEDLVYRALAEAGVVMGISAEAVEYARRLAALKGRTTQTLARGVFPLAPGGMDIRWNIPVREGTRVPVSPGTILAVQRQAAESRDGFDVRGRTLKAEGTAAALHWDETIVLRESGGTAALCAAEGGELVLEGTELYISRLKEIRGDAGEAGGNLNFSGELRITGKVPPGFSAAAGANLFIGGAAESALISAGGKAVIIQGIRGNGRGVVRARTIDAAFAEGATLLAVEDIRLVSRCVDCTVKTNGRLVLSGRGAFLSGGVCRARRGISAAELGSPEGGATEVSFGQDYLIKDQIEAEERNLARLRSALLRAGSGAERDRLLKKQERHSLKLFALREKFDEHHDSAVTITGFIHPGVVIESHGRYYNITEQRRNAAFTFDEETGRIVERKP
ncbi:MAG: FapA family protein, partial [Treponema sp.]|nr:FapA family protein [Treponema sp.]